MSTYENFDAVIRYLERVQGCPQEYLTEDTPSIVNFMTGFYTALIAGGLLPVAHYAECARRVVERAGWRDATRPLWQQMRERGMSDEAINCEILRLRIEAWKLMRDSA